MHPAPVRVPEQLPVVVAAAEVGPAAAAGVVEVLAVLEAGRAAVLVGEAALVVPVRAAEPVVGPEVDLVQLAAAEVGPAVAAGVVEVAVVLAPGRAAVLVGEAALVVPVRAAEPAVGPEVDPEQDAGTAWCVSFVHDAGSVAASASKAVRYNPGVRVSSPGYASTHNIQDC